MNKRIKNYYNFDRLIESEYYPGDSIITIDDDLKEFQLYNKNKELVATSIVRPTMKDAILNWQKRMSK